MKLSCIILDNELSALKKLEEYLSRTPIIGSVKTYSDPGLALRDIMGAKVKVDLFFANPEMPSTSGLELVKKIRDKVHFVILMSAQLRFAVEGYHYNVQHFLLKPFKAEELQKVLNQLTMKIQDQAPTLTIKQGKRNSKILIADIIAVEAALNYIKIHTTSGVVMIYGSMKSIQDELNIYGYFIRINKSFIISKNHIRKIEGKQISMVNGLSPVVGRTYGFSLAKIVAGLPIFIN